MHLMVFKLVVVVGYLLKILSSSPAIAQKTNYFTFNRFDPTSLALDSDAKTTRNGVLELTDGTKPLQMGHAFYRSPITFKNSTNGTVFSFSTTFVFSIVRQHPEIAIGGQGMAFVVAPQKGLPGALPSQHLGLFNLTSNGNSSNHVLAVELDPIQNEEFHDIDSNHVGIDINGLVSIKSKTAGFYRNRDPGSLENLTLISGQPMQVWVDYDGRRMQIDVTLAPFKVTKPSTPLLSTPLDLSSTVLETMYVGFSSASGAVQTSHCVLGWSFEMNGYVLQSLAMSKLPKVPRIGPERKPKLLIIGVPIFSFLVVSFAILGAVYYVARRRKLAEIVEEWELDYGTHRFKFKDLYIATTGFREQELLGKGGFGRVYRGILPTSKIEIAVKRVSHESSQGIREFVAEIVSLGRLRHRNLVSLLGYCRRKGELLLVYDYMPNGSLDKYLYNNPEVTLNWQQRLKIIKGVASGLFYLHEEWEQVVIHRDIKASNVLLDAQMNGRLGDFGLARLYDHGSDPNTTNLMGTLGYLAPEYTRNGRVTKATDVFAFGAFLLEVTTGRRPIKARGMEDIFLVDWVSSLWSRGEILRARDPILGEAYYVEEEVELVLKLGLMCSGSDPGARPSMRQVVQCLEGHNPMQELSEGAAPAIGLMFVQQEGFDDFAMSCPSSVDMTFSNESFLTRI